MSATRPCHKDDCNGTEQFVRDEYDSLGNGGSYEVFKCDACGDICRTQLPD